MIRGILAAVLLGSAAMAADADPLATLLAARDADDRQLVELRQAIHRGQAELLQRLQAAVAAGNAARDRLVAADQAAATASAEAARRSADHERELTLVRQLAERAVVAARLDAPAIRALAGQPPPARVEAALARLHERLQRLPERLALRLAEGQVIGRSGSVARVPVLHLGEARAIACGEDQQHRGLLERSADGAAWLVVGPTLPATVVPRDGAVATIAVDAAGGAAHQPGTQHRTLGEWLVAGRAFIWPIIAVLVVGLAITIGRIVALARTRIDPQRLAALTGHLQRGEIIGARQLVESRASPLDRVLGAGLDGLERPRASREAAVEQALIAETAQLSRGLSAIAVLAGVAPLLGLLGTVTGMIDMFSVIAAQGSGNAKGLSGGISEALICTQAGMLAAIPLLLAHAWLSRLADRRALVLEETACGVLGLGADDAPNQPAALPVQA